MAKRKRARTQSRNNREAEYPGWMWMLFGLAIGLSVAFAIYKKDVGVRQLPQPVAQQPASMDSTIEQESVEAEAVEAKAAESRFTFYDMLPKFEVVIPEEESDVRRDRAVDVVQDPGLYVLQAGSFGELKDADRRRAQLALLGIESTIQRVAIDDKTYHRVRIGPIDNLDRLNRIRSQLRQADIDVLRIRLGE
ncbi:MAG: SPOR domain-containing protein [Proteobacteria bacterium]|nr:SPOR domain-containing protein [Pseudomonadota bacterium]MDA0992234.1 SPOR domain-containing protein [Pseudomonadota bacterium]